MSAADFLHLLAIVWAALAALAVAAGVWEIYDQHRDIARRPGGRAGPL